MRMWMVDPRGMCRMHLIGEHGEIHKHRHVFERGYSIAGRRGQIEPQAMWIRHDELAAEMVRRGHKHDSPYEQPNLSSYSDEDRYGTVDVDASRAELNSRCPECHARVLLEEFAYWRGCVPPGDLFDELDSVVERLGLIRPGKDDE